MLQKVLEANVGLLEMGIPEREIHALVRAADSDFNENEYGFSEFAELLNLAQDKGLVRAEADSDHHLRFYQGDELLSSRRRSRRRPARSRSESESDAASEQPEAEQANERRTRSRSPRRRRSRSSSTAGAAAASKDVAAAPGEAEARAGENPAAGSEIASVDDSPNESVEVSADEVAAS